MQDVLPYSSEVAQLDTGSISTFVQIHNQRDGIGSALIRQTIKDCQQLGYQRLYAIIRAVNQTAIRFYLAQGFSVLSKATLQESGGESLSDAILTELLILDPP